MRALYLNRPPPAASAASDSSHTSTHFASGLGYLDRCLCNYSSLHPGPEATTEFFRAPNNLTGKAASHGASGSFLIRWPTLSPTRRSNGRWTHTAATAKHGARQGCRGTSFAACGPGRSGVVTSVRRYTTRYLHGRYVYIHVLSPAMKGASP